MTRTLLQTQIPAIVMLLALTAQAAADDPQEQVLPSETREESAAKPVWQPQRPSLNSDEAGRKFPPNAALPSRRIPPRLRRPTPDQASGPRMISARGGAVRGEEIPAPAPMPRSASRPPALDLSVAPPSPNGMQTLPPTVVVPNAANIDVLDGCPATGSATLLGPMAAPQACSEPPRLWGRGDYVLWWISGMNTPPLVTTSPVGTSADVAGHLDRADTTILFGNAPIDDRVRSGGRFSVGYWLSVEDPWGIQADYSLMGRQAEHFAADQSTTAILARPYYDIVNPAEDAILVAYPGQLNGAITVDASAEFQSVGISLRKGVFVQPESRVDVLVGYRYVSLDEDLAIRQSSLWTTGLLNGMRTNIEDHFDTGNQFHGSELGVVWQGRRGVFSLEVLGKLAMGTSRTKVAVEGVTSNTIGVQKATFPGGLLAQQTNIGLYESDHFAVIPELGLTLGCNVTERLRANLGYTFLYWSKVARPGDQIDRDVSQLPPDAVVAPARPAFNLQTSDFWAQGLSFGVEYAF